ncbi:hypothetical protein, partial [Streptomyces niveiscabiei]|uniref:hypothetical protein n=1 Tax=Streptomyces niveiscabiei TaxID=164115 RepID=UPI0038F679F2
QATVAAGGTDAGTEVTNEVTLNYKVGGLAQTEKTAEDTFLVDRKIMFLVTNDDGTGELVSVSPGQENSVQSFSIVNSTNGTIDLDLD